MFQTVHSIMFHVSDVKKALDWYSKFLSTKPIYLLDDFPVLRVGNTEICFHLSDSKVSSGKAGSVTYWRVEDFHFAVSRAEKMGGSIHRGPLEIEDSQSICQIADPFGNLFGLVGPKN
jgi:predicted enzyme related to lactoylglutathione lyase